MKIGRIKTMKQGMKNWSRPRALSRRSFLRGLGAAGVSMAMVPTGMRLAHGAEKPTYFTWGGYDDPNFFGAGDIVTSGPFAEKYGGPPNFAIYGDAEEGLTLADVGTLLEKPFLHDAGRV
jgi:spermidine/putrescine-binding protein